MSAITDANQTVSPAPSARQVFEILAREHATMLLAFLRAQVSDLRLVDELFQDSLLTAWRRLADYDRDRPFGPWLRGIAGKLITAERRRQPRVSFLSDPQVAEQLEHHFVTMDPQRDGGNDIMVRLQRCLSGLPEAMRQAIDLVYREGLRLKEAASQLGSSEEAMKKRVQRGRSLLAECMTQAEGA